MTEEKVTEAITSSLRDKIVRGDFGKSGRIPSVSQIAKERKASRTTVYQALQTLQLEGILISKEGSYYANYPIMRIPGITPTFDRYLIEQGLKPSMENIIEPELVPMPADVAHMFHQQEGVHVVHRMRKQGTIEVPYRIAENWYPASLAGEFVDQMRVNPNLDVLSEIRRVHGVFITDVHEDILARIPTHEEVEHLAIMKTTPVLEVRRSSFAHDGNPVMFNKIILVATYFLLSYDYKPDHWKNKSA